MRLAAITDEISQDFEHALKVMYEYGVKGAELRGLWNTNIADLSPEQVKEAVRLIKQYDMEVVGLATPFYKCDLRETENEFSGPMHLAPVRTRQKQMEMLERCINLAHIFETRLLRVFSFWRKCALTPDVEAEIVEAFEAPVAIAERENLILILENEHACMIGSGSETKQFMSHIHSSHLRVCWDPGNAFALGEKAFPDGYDAVKEYIAHVHVKDARRVIGPSGGYEAAWTVIGEGEVDYASQFAALKSDHYNGWISLETHFKPEHGSGADGKGTAEDGSRACLTALLKMLAN